MNISLCQVDMFKGVNFSPIAQLFTLLANAESNFVALKSKNSYTDGASFVEVYFHLNCL
jgi:hypothetical protein